MLRVTQVYPSRLAITGYSEDWKGLEPGCFLVYRAVGNSIVFSISDDPTYSRPKKYGPGKVKLIDTHHGTYRATFSITVLGLDITRKCLAEYIRRKPTDRVPETHEIVLPYDSVERVVRKKKGRTGKKRAEEILPAPQIKPQSEKTEKVDSGPVYPTQILTRPKNVSPLFNSDSKAPQLALTQSSAPDKPARNSDESEAARGAAILNAVIEKGTIGVDLDAKGLVRTFNKRYF